MAYTPQVLSAVKGGTGVANTSTITLAGALVTSGANSLTLTTTGPTNVTLPTSGTLATTAQIPSTPISLANGGTNASLTASNGGIFYSSSTAGAILAGTATANQVLLSGSSTTPAWSTATYPATTGATTFLTSTSANVVTTDTFKRGTFTPGVSFGGGTTGITYATQSGNYVQIGNCIFVSVTITLTSKGSSTGAAKVTGFPISTGTNGALNNFDVPYYSFGLTATNLSALIQMDASATTGGLYQTTITGATSSLADTNFANGTTFGFCGIYFTN